MEDFCECGIESPGSISHGVRSYNVRSLFSVVMPSSSDQEVRNSIPDSTVGYFFSEELFHGMYRLGISSSFSVSFFHFLTYVFFGGGLFTLLITD